MLKKDVLKQIALKTISKAVKVETQDSFLNFPPCMVLVHQPKRPVKKH